MHDAGTGLCRYTCNLPDDSAWNTNTNININVNSKAGVDVNATTRENEKACF
jgi:hypothetical protein